MADRNQGAGVMGDRFVRRSALVCLVGLGGFLAWAGFAPLAEGVPAAGQIVVENDRQVHQPGQGREQGPYFVDMHQARDAVQPLIVVFLLLSNPLSSVSSDPLLGDAVALPPQGTREELAMEMLLESYALARSTDGSLVFAAVSNLGNGTVPAWS